MESSNDKDFRSLGDVPKHSLGHNFVPKRELGNENTYEILAALRMTSSDNRECCQKFKLTLQFFSENRKPGYQVAPAKAARSRA